MNNLDGKATSKAIQQEIADEVAQRVANGFKRPHLAAVLIGADGASQTYVNSKVKACGRCGFESTLVQRPADISEEEVLQIVEDLNTNDEIDGFIVQLPLPKHINEQNIVNAIAEHKDVDGFHPASVGKMVLNLPTFLPATPYGIMQLLERYEVPTEGKHAVVIGRSHIVGSPMSILLSKNGDPGNCTVTLAHSRTKNLEKFTKDADIIVVALGIPEFLKGDMVKEGVVVIDVGITRVEDASKAKGYAIKGDVAYDEVAPKCSFITPVPGGVGPMTIASLLKNTLLAAEGKKA